VAARLLSVAPLDLLPVIGAFNVGLFLIAVRRLVRALLGSTAYALPAALALLFLWNQPWGWSGFYAFGLLPLTATYPYWFAQPLALLVIAIDADGMGGRGRLALDALALAIVFLIHPLTGIFLGVALVCLWVAQHQPPRWIAWALAWLAGGLATSLAWPYYPVAAAIAAAPDFVQLQFSGTYALFYDRWIARVLVPGLPGLVWVAWQVVRRRRDFIALGALTCGAMYLLNAVWPQSSLLARMVVFVALLLQLGTVALLAAAPRSWRPWAALAFAAWIAFHAGPELRDGFARARPIGAAGTLSNRDRAALLAPIGARIRPGDLVVATLDESWMLPGLIDCTVVASAHSSPFMHDYAARRSDLERFWSPDTDARDRSAVLDRHAAAYVLAAGRDQLAIVRQVDHRLHEELSVGQYTLFRILR
jgi:hypothetical protein